MSQADPCFSSPWPQKSVCRCSCSRGTGSSHEQSCESCPGSSSSIRKHPVLCQLSLLLHCVGTKCPPVLALLLLPIFTLALYAGLHKPSYSIGPPAFTAGLSPAFACEGISGRSPCLLRPGLDCVTCVTDLPTL